MAWTVSVVDKTVFGNKRVVALSCVADSAEAAVNTGLSIVDYFSAGAVSCTSAPKIRMNVGSTSTAANGTLGCSGFVSGDIILLTVYGR
jgi:hypothetical protein